MSPATYFLVLWFLGAVLAIPGRMVFVHSRKLAGKPVRSKTDEELVILGLAVWPASIVIGVLWVFGYFWFSKLPKYIIGKMMVHPEKKTLIDMHQPDLGPSRTPRCAACGQQIAGNVYRQFRPTGKSMDDVTKDMIQQINAGIDSLPARERKTARTEIISMVKEIRNRL